MTKYLIIVVCCFLYSQKTHAQNDKFLSNQFVVDMGVGVSGAYTTDLMIKKTSTSILYTPIGQIFLKKYFSKVCTVKIPMYAAVGSMIHLSSNPSKPIMPQVRVGYRYRHITAFVAQVWQKAGTTDYVKHPDNKSYIGYGIEVNKKIRENGVLYCTISKNDRHVVAMISMGFIF